MSNWTQQKRKGYPSITPPMMNILLCLKSAKQADNAIIELPHINPRTVKSLIARDWVILSNGLDGIRRYAITSRGLKALSFYEKRINRGDGICPNCQERPRRVYTTGRIGFYCLECDRQRQYKQYHLNKVQANSDRPCSHCKQKPRHVWSSGRVCTYCHDCHKAIRKAERDERYQHDLARAEQGDLLLCTKCNAEPRLHTSHLYPYCAACYQHWKKDEAQRRKERKFKQIISEGVKSK